MDVLPFAGLAERPSYAEADLESALPCSLSGLRRYLSFRSLHFHRMLFGFNEAAVSIRVNLVSAPEISANMG